MSTIQMQMGQFITALDAVISDTIKNSYPASWLEDHITLSVLKAVGTDFPHVRLHSPFVSVESTFSAYKLRGKPETLHCDIAMHLRVRRPDGSVLQGVGFLEAKVRDRAKNNFPQLKITQLRRIVRNSPRALVLLYDHSRVTTLRPHVAMEGPIVHSGTRWVPFTHSVVVPIDVVLATKAKDTGLYVHGCTLARQIVERFLFGLDLHHDQAVIDRVNAFAVDRQDGVPNFLVRIDVALDGEPLEFEGGEVNLDRFQPVDDLTTT